MPQLADRSSFNRLVQEQVLTDTDNLRDFTRLNQETSSSNPLAALVVPVAAFRIVAKLIEEGFERHDQAVERFLKTPNIETLPT